MSTVTSWNTLVATALDTLRAKGATVHSEPSTDGWTTCNSYGTPNWNSRTQCLEGPPAFMKHAVRGIAWPDVVEAFGGTNGQPVSIDGVDVYERVDGAEIPARGIVVAMSWGRSPVAAHDERGFPHLAITGGVAEVRYFAT